MFNSLKIKALDLLNSAVKPLIDALTKAGALRKAVNDKGGNDRIARDIKWLSYSDNKQQTYDRLLYGYFLEENKALADWRKAQGGGMGSIAYYKNQYEASKQLRLQFQNAAKPILNPQVDVVVPDPDEGGGKGGGKGGGSTAKIRALKVEISESRTELQLLKDELKTVENSMAPYGKLTEEWKEMNAYAGELRIKIKEMNGEVGLKGISTLDMVKVPTAADIIKKGQKRIENFKAPEQPKAERSMLGDMQKFVSGLQSVSSGLQQMGIKLPDGVQKIMSTVQGLMTIIQGVQSIIEVFSGTAMAANTASLTGNTTALATLTGAVIANTSAIAANTVTEAVPLLANGGIVHAAGGYRVPGHHFSGDRVPAMLNSGELVLNTSQQEVVAQALQSSRTGSSAGGGGTPYVTGETILLAAGNTIRRRGQGEIVTTGMLRRLGIM
jgi:hypothetical protein